jgi:hypothetical protein
MHWHPTTEEIAQQKKAVFGAEPRIHLNRPCKINEGILKPEADERSQLIKLFEKHQPQVTYFIPASGSGSRMLEFLYTFQAQREKEIEPKMERFLNSLEDFAFYRQLPNHVKSSIEQEKIDLEKLIDSILNSPGLNLGQLPKGLIPFHKLGPFILTPLQEHLIQGCLLTESNPNFHFTIQKEFQEAFLKIIQSTTALSGADYSVGFSEQSIQSNSIAFQDNGEVARNMNNEVITRPSGHGALLPTLNSLESEVVLIKNIDNVQHYSKANESIATWKMLSGLLLQFRQDAKTVYDNPSRNGLVELNKKYQLFDAQTLEDIHSEEAIRQLIDRPTRVCGMVKNEGQPGGGPFWVENAGKITKQIVEKAQISAENEQRALLLRSTHFNPVMIALSPRSLENKKFDLLDFRDEEAYFIVKKTAEGQNIRYMEQPGLWNGSMANWNSIFVEIPNSVFSPVKTILDLLDPLHTSH